ncbi:bifunctional hydroxymethylpyrimidine kinase/phosphomethylpyrimidine kinase [Hydrogenovibrio sp. 3SP14C1]|uniref:bifunctional hydroxymethylpyrimidine kinase/phosphomethylpyrimidine kinase n=1 Tax=Hydrogenovibrio sp. 3SP14C1 TaxID=3038774 RepID=UPI002415AA90|nr:bifunctional hydroxymethylpyrimidine kinase/phosphomethylpyrimidine kinase [Hydrogenovibrio sp. 3SP14C1]MDG4813292.1 bifunctional hydroxymethylpyrimidine kinase/phosphomethylpyrimidine kinase [Hydrogenovibrio sp. 3SP14C1]
MSNHTPTVLSIAGSDPYGGAGIQADLKSIHALGGYALTCITALTAQNSQGVAHVAATSADTLSHQLETLLQDIKVDAVKIGMLANADLIHVVADKITQYSLKNIVLDTVLISSSGHPLLDENAVAGLKEQLFPKATVITPNLPEINHLLGKDFHDIAPELDTISDAFVNMGVQAMVAKGGHGLETNLATDVLLQPGHSPMPFSSPRIQTSHTHGTGCSFSSAIATFLAQGKDLASAVQQSKQQMHQWFNQSESLQLNYQSNLGHRKEPLLHLDLGNEQSSN